MTIKFDFREIALNSVSQAKVELTEDQFIGLIESAWREIGDQKFHEMVRKATGRMACSPRAWG